MPKTGRSGGDRKLRRGKAALSELAVGTGRKTFRAAVDQLHQEARLSADAVIDRMREALGAESDAELAWLFGLSPQSLSNRRARNSVPYREAVFVATWAHVSLEYLLTGEGKP